MLESLALGIEPDKLRSNDSEPKQLLEEAMSTPAPVIKPAKVDAEKNAIYRLRYDVYVREMNRYRNAADHEREFLREPEDDISRLYCAVDNTYNVVGTMRLTWGGDAPIPERMIAQYDLEPFLARIPSEQIIVGERFMVTTAYRGTDLIFRLFKTYLELVNEHRIQLIFGDCEPHLLNLYLGLGFRTYTRKNVNSAETGYLIPLVMIPEDIDYFRQVSSPLANIVKNFGEDCRTPACVADILAKGSAVQSERLVSKQEYWSEVHQALSRLTESRPLLFDGMSEQQIEHCLSKSNVIECRRGDRIIKKGNTAQNMYVALSGTLEVRDRDNVVGVISAGDVVGEMAFLLNTARTMDVVAATDDVRILSLSESIIKEIMKSDPESAAALLLNVSKMLCLKLLKRPA